MDSFLDKDDIVQDISTFDESSLVFWDDPGKNSFQPGSNDLCYELVTSIAQRDRPEYRLKEVALFSFGIRARNEELVLPPNLLVS